MAQRTTQVAAEALQGPGDPKSRITQTAVEVLVGPAGGNARATQLAVEALVSIAAPAADVRQTQTALEAARANESALDVRATQDALEVVQVPPNDLWTTAACLEVAFPGYTPPAPASRRNHSFIGVWMGTGHADNASFNF